MKNYYSFSAQRFYRSFAAAYRDLFKSDTPNAIKQYLDLETGVKYTYYPGEHIIATIPDNLTQIEFDIEGLYCYGWEVVTCEETYSEARARVREYRENEAGTAFRMKKRRVRAWKLFYGVCLAGTSHFRNRLIETFNDELAAGAYANIIRSRGENSKCVIEYFFGRV